MNGSSSSVADGGRSTNVETNIPSIEGIMDPETSARLIEDLIRELRELTERLDLMENRLSTGSNNFNNIAKGVKNKARAGGGSSKNKNHSEGGGSSVEGSGNSENNNTVVIKLPNGFYNTPPANPNTPPANPNVPPANPNTPPANPNVPPVLSPEQQALNALKPLIDDARDRYALETAKDRNKFWGRFMKSENPLFTKFIKKIPGIGDLAEGLADKINNSFLVNDRDIRLAREEYDLLLQQAQGYEESIILSNINPNLPPNVQDQMIISQIYQNMSAEDGLLEGRIIHHRGGQSGKATRFSNWWARQKGFIGNIKKVAAMVVVGATVGATVAGGILVAPIAIPGAVLGVSMPSLLASVTGVGMGLRLNKKLANSYTDNIKKNPNAKTVAQFESDRDSLDRLAKRRQMISDVVYGTATVNAPQTVGEVASSNIIGGVERSTDERVKGNRNRLQIMGSIAAVAGGISGRYIGGYLENIISGDSPGVGATLGDFSSYDYPWNWAADIFGPDNAMNQLFDLAQKAQEAGYNIQWNNLSDGSVYNDWISINGNSETSYVIGILNQFR